MSAFNRLSINLVDNKNIFFTIVKKKKIKSYLKYLRCCGTRAFVCIQIALTKTV